MSRVRVNEKREEEKEREEKSERKKKRERTPLIATTRLRRLRKDLLDFLTLLVTSETSLMIASNAAVS